MTIQQELQILASETTVMVELLAEDAELIGMIRRGESHEACLTYINENY